METSTPARVRRGRGEPGPVGLYTVSLAGRPYWAVRVNRIELDTAMTPRDAAAACAGPWLAELAQRRLSSRQRSILVDVDGRWQFRCYQEHDASRGLTVRTM